MPRCSLNIECALLLQQSGFTPGRSTLDLIVALRLLAERRHEYRQQLYAAYIDLTAAFDSLDRNSLWNILKTIGIPPKLDSGQHITDLGYIGLEAYVGQR